MLPGSESVGGACGATGDTACLRRHNGEMVTLSAEMIGLIVTVVTILAAIFGMGLTVRQGAQRDAAQLRAEMQAMGSELRAEMHAMGSELRDADRNLLERTERMEKSLRASDQALMDRMDGLERDLRASDQALLDRIDGLAPYGRAR